MRLPIPIPLIPTAIALQFEGRPLGTLQLRMTTRRWMMLVAVLAVPIAIAAELEAEGDRELIRFIE
jgi:hypothetical protein